MASEEKNALRYILILCMYLISLTLQGVGLFTPNWASDGNCSRIGLYYRCCGNGSECQTDNDETYMNKQALIFEATSFGLLLLIPVVILTLGASVILLSTHMDCEKAETCLIGLASVIIVCMYLIAGVLSIHGCILVNNDIPHSKGYSYYLSLFAGIIIYLEYVITILIHILVKNRRKICACCQPVRSKGQRIKRCLSELPSTLKNCRHRTTYTSDVGNIKVKVIVGRMALQKVDVIVNSTSSNLKFNNRPGLSKSLLEKAGQSLQDECDADYPNGINIGEIAITNGHKLNCQKVYHGSLPCWYSKPIENLRPEDAMSNFIRDCLDKAESSDFKSIAFPALGTGYLKYPVDIVVTKMIKGIKDFEKERKSTCIKEVRIVIYPESNDWIDIKQEFVDQLKGVNPEVITAIFSVTEGETPSRGTKEFLVYKYYEKTHPPHYWTQFHNRISTKEWNTQHKGRPFKVTDVDKKTYDEIVRIFKSTWGLFPPNVVSIQRIENIYLFDQYQQECQRLFRKAVAEGKITPIKKARGSSGSVVTTKQMDKTWRDHLYPEINEHYLFHGTSVDNVDVIISQGFDCRLSNGGRVGFGIYGAEKSAKSKTYVDENENGESKMFLMRMCLGNVYVTKEHVEFNRPPCKQCDKEVCLDHTQCYDSVIADGGAFSDREFVVYDRHQCYPEYLITYK